MLAAGQACVLDAKQLIGRLQNRMGMKRSRSDTSKMYAKRTFSGKMATISEADDWDDSASGLRFDMPNLEPHIDSTGLLTERGAFQHSLHAV